MKYHNNAKLTIFQRKELALRINDGEVVSKVAKDFNVRLSFIVVYRFFNDDNNDIT